MSTVRREKEPASMKNNLFEWHYILLPDAFKASCSEPCVVVMPDDMKVVVSGPETQTEVNLRLAKSNICKELWSVIYL